MRDCADGSVSDGVTLASFFLKDGLICSSRNRQGDTIEEYKVSPDKFVSDLPLAVLVNNSTAGPAEIAAGALKDRKRAVVIGDKTFGVGSSQKRIPLRGGAVLVLSTAKFYTPGGKMIQDESIRNTGIKPDIQAPDDDRHQELLVDAYYDDQDDAGKFKKLRETIKKEQLDKAVEYLIKGLVPAKRAA